jgi:hypothetical protein
VEIGAVIPALTNVPVIGQRNVAVEYLRNPLISDLPSATRTSFDDLHRNVSDSRRPYGSSRPQN